MCAHVMGILFMEKNRDYLSCILDKKNQQQSDIDDPINRMDHIFYTISSEVNDLSCVVSNPDGWQKK